jgi:hypothetical protein
MSIVDGLSRQNKEGWQPGNPLSAPPPEPTPSRKRASLDTARPPPAGKAGVQRSASVRSGTSTATRDGMHSPNRDARPLKSALRHSRTPSPMPPAAPPAAPPLDAPAVSAALVVEAGKVKRVTPDDDGASVESFETGHEDFDDTTPPAREAAAIPSPPMLSSPPRVSSPSTLTPPPRVSSPRTLGAPTNGSRGPGSDVSSGGSAATATAGPARRKSVRMSLTPQFAPTPPALEDPHTPNWERRGSDRELGAQARPPRAEEKARWESAGERDMWADSSADEEDEGVDEYKAAKSLLAKAGRS